MDRKEIRIGVFLCIGGVMSNKEYKDTRKSVEFVIKGSKKMWEKYLERLRKAKEKGCTTCGCCK